MRRTMTMNVAAVNDGQRTTCVELRVPQNSNLNFRIHLAQLHLLSAAIEARTPGGEAWTVEFDQLDGLGVIRLQLEDGSKSEAAARRRCFRS